jgi:hypothetical protein
MQSGPPFDSDAEKQVSPSFKMSGNYIPDLSPVNSLVNALYRRPGKGSSGIELGARKRKPACRES